MKLIITKKFEYTDKKEVPSTGLNYVSITDGSTGTLFISTSDLVKYVSSVDITPVSDLNGSVYEADFDPRGRLLGLSESSD